MTSRLDRLFVLLEAGSGAATRQAAARQLGEVQRAHPEELHRLLGRLVRHLRSNVWETRIAASQAVEAILSNVPEWHPTMPIKEEDIKQEDDGSRLRCETFDIEKVLKQGAHLMGSEGNEYDMDEDAMPPRDAAERIEKQRKQLEVAAQLGVDLTTLCTSEDLVLSKPQTSKNEPKKRPVQELVGTGKLSSREMNLAKRRARLLLNKQRSRDCEEPTTPEPENKKPKLESSMSMEFTEVYAVPDGAGGWTEGARWPLEGWCCVLQAQLFAAAWEARHGAASALRDLLRARVAASAVYRLVPPEQLEEAHQEWLEDMALRLICVLALDRFGDFVSDQVVAPVRETSAQALGVALAGLGAARVRRAAALLAVLARQPQWEARHGALLAFKYLLAARQEVACSCGVLQQVTAGLSDGAEDVAAAAAAALVPCCRALLAREPAAAAALVQRLCALLHHQDDLASPAQAYMALLAAIMALPEAAELLHPIDLSDILPRLWPYLDHSTSSVRKATLQTLLTLTRPVIKAKNNCTPTTNVVTSRDDIINEEHRDLNGEHRNILRWTPELLQDCMRHIYQRILFEHVNEIQDVAVLVWQNLLRFAPLSTILLSSCGALSTWLCLAMQPPRLAVERALLLTPPERPRANSESEMSAGAAAATAAARAQRYMVGGADHSPAAAAAAAATDNVTRARVKAALLLGQLSCYIVQPAPGIEYKPEDESPIDCYVKVMVAYLRSGSALQRLVAGLVIASWAKHTREYKLYPPQKNGDPAVVDITQLAPPLLTTTLHNALNQSLYYDEVAVNCNRVLQEARDLHAMMKHYKLPVDGDDFNNIIRLEQVMHLATVSQPLVANMKSKRVSQTLEERRTTLQSIVTQCSGEQATLSVSVQAALASACAELHCLPEKLNPVVRPLMDSIKKETSEDLQRLSARALAVLLEQLLTRDPCPNNKVLNNLKTFLRCDSEFTPRLSLQESSDDSADNSDAPADNQRRRTHAHHHNLDKYNGILTLWEQQRTAESRVPKRGRPPTVTYVGVERLIANEDEGRKMLRIQRRGATLALTSVTRHFADDLQQKLPQLWEFITQPFTRPMYDSELESMEESVAEELISRLQVVEAVISSLSDAARLSWCGTETNDDAAIKLTGSQYTATRHMAGRALAAAITFHPRAPALLTKLVSVACGAASAAARCGAAEALSRAVDALQLRVVPYVALLVLPLLGRMSDHCEAVRVMSTRCFATLIQLMPLDGAVPEPDGLTDEMRARRENDKKFLDQLFNPKTIQDYKLPIKLTTELRSYQQAGVNWLRFLYSYKLHGVLCDDMGLGKTLQSIIVVAASHLEDQRAPPSLVVCPPTLTGHWVFEVNKFIPSVYLKPLQYVGPPFERERLRAHVKFYNLIIASYDIVRKDIDFFSSVKWNYCILDEGHVIKNGKTKAFKAIKQIEAKHRLILSGTPIQNNVLELWSLFDFLMPGLLGSERQFTARYSRPILAARDPKATPHHLQQGALACEALHRQVLPFLLRRTKEDVLKELPPKITQDYYCELSPLQRKLYERVCSGGMPTENGDNTSVFQALHYLQNVCNHPKLVLTAEHPDTARLTRDLADNDSSLDDIHNAAKLPALKQLLLDCGIGISSLDADAVVSQHRALIFCQLKKMLDIVENDLLKRHLPNVTYLRLDGSVPPHQRHSIVTRFNNDVSIDLLLLTTTVGGLGVNLTGADTVIFVEHDWNPMKDLQAMDRAHRIGQRKVVNVYRLITRGTLEEKIMGLQKFKLMTANTVISSENAAMETMGTDKLLDLFQLNDRSSNQSSNQLSNQSSNQPSSSTGQAVWDALPELWDDKQYEEEYDMTNFIKSLNKFND